MRVLMLSWEYPPYVIGGLGKHVAELVPALVQQDVEVHLVTPRWTGGDSTKKRDNLHIHRVDPPPPSGWARLSHPRVASESEYGGRSNTLAGEVGAFSPHPRPRLAHRV